MDARILICTVLFNQNLENCNSFKSLLNSYDDVIIIDNSSSKIIINEIVAKNNKWKYVRYPSNPGLSFAYNYASKYALENGYNWMLISDQDTIFPEGAIDVYLSTLKENPDIKLFVPKVLVLAGTEKYMSPVRMIHYFTKLSTNCPSGIINPTSYGIINSGLLINISAFWEVGGYNEKVWLDFADFQFIERFGTKYNKACVINCECEQHFSNEVQTINQKLARFKYFCSSLKHYHPVNKANYFWIITVALKRALSLCIKSKSLKPISILTKDFIL